MDSAVPRSVAGSVLLILILSLPLYLVHLGRTGLSDPDEPYYAVPAHEMMDSGTYDVPVFHGRPWFDKPILFYWIVMTAFLLFGVSEASARIGSVLAAAGGLLAVFALGRRVCRHPMGPLGAAIVLATSFEYVILARAAVTDMALTLFITLGMLAAARCIEDGRPLQAGLAGAAFGLATLTKGPVGALLPALALVMYLIAARRADLVRPRLLATALAGFVLTAGPWYVYMELRYPNLLLGTFLGQGNLGRFLAPEHRAFPFYYVAVLLAGLLPWSGGLPAALWHAARPWIWSDERRAGARPGPLFLLCWFGAVLAVFSVSASKLPSYILPAFPPAALLLGDYWAGALARVPVANRPRGTMFSAWLGILIGAGALLALVLVLHRAALAAAAPSALAAGTLLVVGALLGLFAVRRGSWSGMFLAQGSAAAAAILIVCVFALPAIEEFDSTRPLVSQLRAQGIDGTIVGAYRARNLSLEFYLGRQVPLVDDPGELRTRVGAEPGGVWIVLTRDLPRLRADAALTVEPLLERPCRSAVRLGPAHLGMRHGR